MHYPTVSSVKQILGVVKRRKLLLSCEEGCSSVQQKSGKAERDSVVDASTEQKGEECDGENPAIFPCLLHGDSECLHWTCAGSRE
jgi:hypothetical protein